VASRGAFGAGGIGGASTGAAPSFGFGRLTVSLRLRPPRVVVSLETTNRDRVPGEEEGGWSISGRDSLCDDPCRASSLSLPTLPGHCQRADACTACTHAPGTEHGGEPGSPPSCLQGSPFLCLPPDANAESEENDSRSGNTETGKARDCRCHRHPSALHDPDDCCRPQVTVTEA
jgi:hypothetical protein